MYASSRSKYGSGQEKPPTVQPNTGRFGTPPSHANAAPSQGEPSHPPSPPSAPTIAPKSQTRDNANSRPSVDWYAELAANVHCQHAVCELDSFVRAARTPTYVLRQLQGARAGLANVDLLRRKGQKCIVDDRNRMPKDRSPGGDPLSLAYRDREHSGHRVHGRNLTGSVDAT
ncbi:hypothetical protein BD626DRAFT_526940 [Schizophyllum amplum]|uniref:Uncharacterized protein n=1 Tax=Schizophyllum amplum TaxID=97359 RepID=A0A550BSB2_9AGAR|nr:hypothetical protein BD626DRAFT_526940 [Auriculariopsis ampla]